MTGDDLRLRAVLIQGPFTDDDVKRFAALMREIEQTRPEQHFSLFVDDRQGDSTLAEAVDLVARVFPHKARPQ